MIWSTNVGDRNGFSHGFIADVLHHILDEDRALSDHTLNSDLRMVGASELDGLTGHVEGCS